MPASGSQVQAEHGVEELAGDAVFCLLQNSHNIRSNSSLCIDLCECATVIRTSSKTPPNTSARLAGVATAVQPHRGVGFDPDCSIACHVHSSPLPRFRLNMSVCVTPFSSSFFTRCLL